MYKRKKVDEDTDFVLKQLTVSIGQKVRRRREELYLSVNKLAKRTGISVYTIAKIERGNALPSIYKLLLITKALNMSFSQLFQTKIVVVKDDNSSLEDTLLGCGLNNVNIENAKSYVEFLKQKQNKENLVLT